MKLVQSVNGNDSDVDFSKRLADPVDIMECFPKEYSPRPNQLETLKKYEELSKSYEKIIVCDPVGGGKTFLGCAILGYHSPGFMVTATKGLQDQVIRDFPSIADIRGKNNFKCLQQMKTKPESFIEKLITIKDFKKARMTADFGRCSKKEYGKIIQCVHAIPSLYNLDENGKPYKQCDYKEQMQYGLSKPRTLTNYAMYFNLVRMDVYGIHRQISVFDEAHTIEGEIVKLIGIDITQNQLQDRGLVVSDFKLTEFDQVMRLLIALSNSYAHILDVKEINKDAYPELNEEKISKRKEKIDILYSDMNKNPDNFAFYYDDFTKKLTIKPINLTSYVKKFIKSPRQVFLSGTIDKDYFPKTLGLDPTEFGFINNEKSYFDAKARVIQFDNIASMSYRNNTKENLTLMHKRIADILTIHKDDRGLIQTSSYSRCNDIASYLSRTEHRDRILLIHADNPDGLTVNEMLKKHSETPGSVILSSSFWMGYDLKGDLANFQIIEKFPRLPWYDPWVVKKRRNDFDWYIHKAITKTLQGFGRVVRTKNDKAITYCLDSDIQRELNNHPSMIPKSYHDVIFGDKTATGLDDCFWS